MIDLENYKSDEAMIAKYFKVALKLEKTPLSWKPLTILLPIVFLFWTCGENTSKEESTAISNSQGIIDSLKSDSAPIQVKPKKTDSIPTYEIIDAPCSEIQEFVRDMEKLKWTSDPSRLEKITHYSELNQQKIQRFGGKPFYPIKFEDSRLYQAYNWTSLDRHFKSFDYELFKGVQNIWGYFYWDQFASNFIPDGLIEQWTFKTENEAVKAIREIRKLGSLIYFNTNPFFWRIGNKLIVFQTRAMMFSLDDQKPLFEKFKLQHS